MCIMVSCAMPNQCWLTVPKNQVCQVQNLIQFRVTKHLCTLICMNAYNKYAHTIHTHMHVTLTKRVDNGNVL
jgi:hypothetical protein